MKQSYIVSIDWEGYVQYGEWKRTKKPLHYLGIYYLFYIQSIFIEFLPRADAVLGTGDIAENKAKWQLSQNLHSSNIDAHKVDW